MKFRTYERLTREEFGSVDEPFIIEFNAVGAPLVISFNCYRKEPKFQFYGQLTRVEEASGRPVNRIYLHDENMAWYQYGIKGLGNNVTETAASLQSIIEEMKPTKIITIGESMGAYAAIMFGILLNADKALAFSPLSCFNLKQLHAMGDHRWNMVVSETEKNPPNPFYTDLVSLLNSSETPPKIEIYYGTKPTTPEAEQCPESVNIDAAHAFRFSYHPEVLLCPIHTSAHGAMADLYLDYIITDLLIHRILDKTNPLPMHTSNITPQWVEWVHQGLKNGFPLEELFRDTQEHLTTSQMVRMSLNYHLYGCLF